MIKKTKTDPESKRLADDARRIENWKRWGPYISERAWGTVREDYSQYGTAWEHFPHDHARSKAYRWGEDGIAGICDRHQFVCFAPAFWNGKDPILKERLFGLTGNEGNHGEDVKECYFHLDSTPTHSYMKYLYKYPQAEFPYSQLVEENRRLDRSSREFELLDTGVFNEERYFDIFIEYAKGAPEDILIQITAINRGPDHALIYLLPTLWYRNTWRWSTDRDRPELELTGHTGNVQEILLHHFYYGERRFYLENAQHLLFTENETNGKLYGFSDDAHAKDAFHRYLVQGESSVEERRTGTKMCGVYKFSLAPGEEKSARLRLTDIHFDDPDHAFGQQFNKTFATRKEEGDVFYSKVIPNDLSEDGRSVMRQSLAGLLWNKQYFYYDISKWLRGDPTMPTPPTERLQGRNSNWTHLYNSDVISMPDKWEYPWYAAWDLAFHCIPFALIDSNFAKNQLILLLREWYMHPSGQLPAYEWSFDDVNPPVHAWAAWRVYKIEKKRRKKGDLKFLARVFHKLLLNFTWWINRKDVEGRNIFQGGFLGLDNIGIFDRNAPLPTGGRIEQADGTSWMGMYCLNMMTIALELAREYPEYEDVASKFFEHFVLVCDAMNNIAGENIALWDEFDGFYYDVLLTPRRRRSPLKFRSALGLIPLFGVEILDSDLLDRLPGFKRRMEWFIKNRPKLAINIESKTEGEQKRWLLSLVSPARLKRILQYMLDEEEFLSSFGIRSLSKSLQKIPYFLHVGDTDYHINYEPAESATGLFGGNSNWRGPIWFPINYLIIESLQKFDHYLGENYRVEFPARSGNFATLAEVARDLSRRLTRIFLRGEDGKRAVYGDLERFQSHPNWRDLILFYEYFHGDSGAGLGASHQTGWTALVAKLLQQSGE